jgi:NAD(P)-dependent dehydrogenase (short-subunit alcohol dehydrogenase family)
MQFAGQVAIVTGAATGLGRAYAEALGKEGACVVVADIDVQGADEVASALRATGAQAVAVGVDVADVSSTELMARAAVEAFGGIDVLVNNAAVMLRFLDTPRKPFWDYTAAEWELVLRVNVIGSWACARAVLPAMRARRRGKIVNVSSNMAYGTDLSYPAGMCAYTASKSAVLGLTRALAGEVGDFGVTVNAVAPGVTRTETITAHIPDEHLDAMASVQAIKRIANTEDIVGAVLFLCSPESDFVTGQCLIVDGGFMTA